MLTRSNIAYNLHNSPHLLGVDYDNQTITYHFSSELYRSKFLSRLEENRLNIEKSLTNRFGVRVKINLLADLRLYSSIEKRGFLISINGVYKECQSDITLDGTTMITANYQGR